MAINTQSFSALISSLVASIQGAATAFIDFSVGSTLLAVSEAHIGLAMWLQGSIIQVASLTRFATSSGADADSWAADLNFFRLPAQGATGQVTFSRATATAQAVVPAATLDASGAILSLGAVVQTQDGTQQYAVIPDTTQAAYSPSLNGYVLGAGVSSVGATVKALTTGSASNVASGLINTLGTAIAGVDGVNNSGSFANGADAESDTAFKARFVLYIQSLAEATVAAISNAIEGVQQDISFTITEDQDINGNPDEGYFYVVVDDGTGTPSAPFLSKVSNAVDAVRPIGSTYNVFPPSLQNASVTMSITTGPTYVHDDVTALVTTALTNFINALPIGASLPYTRLAQVAYDASPGVINVGSVSLNGGTADLTSSSVQIIKAGAVTVT